MRKALSIFALLCCAALAAAQTRMDASSQLAFRMTNDGSTGTTINQLAKINSSGNAVNAGTSDTSIPVYVVVGGAGTTGVAQLATGGAVTCLFDAGGGTSGHYVQVSSSVAGTCHDAGATIPTSGWVLGTLLTSPAANATGSVLLVQGYLANAGGGSFTGGTLTSELTLAASAAGAASENVPSGTAPTTPVAGDFWRDANGFNFFTASATNGLVDLVSNNAGATCAANTVRYTADSNVAKVCENGGALQEIVQLTKTQSVQNKSFDTTDTGIWQPLGTVTSTTSTISVTFTPRKHIHGELDIGGYSGGGGVARFEAGNTTTVDTGTNYSFAGTNLPSGTSATPTQATFASGSTAQEGCPVSGSTTTAGRLVIFDIDSAAAAVKYSKIDSVGVNTAATSTPNLASVGCFWSNATQGIGIIQFKACSTTTGTCTTVNFTATTKLTLWGRDDN